MNIMNSVVVTTITFLFLAGTAMAEVPQNRVDESASFLQTDESAEFAAYEFEDSSENSETETMTKEKASGAEDSHEWTPEIWSEIQ